MDDLQQFATLFRHINQFDKYQGLEFEILAPGEIIYRLKVQEKHLSSPGIAHGAVIAGMMDCVLGLAALTQAITEKNLTSTVEFKLNFLRPVRLGDELEGHGKIEFKGKSLLISVGEIRQRESRDLVAKALGTFNTYPIEKKSELWKSLQGI
jgi:uncharacterized protein (TIGR00369 family)